MEAVAVSSAAREPSNWAKWIRNIYETDSPDLQRVPGVDANHRLHHRSD